MTEGRKAYTIDDIARKLCVSKTTVSRAISGKGRISDATRQRVLNCIREYDYRPNVLAQALAHSKSYNLGLLLPVDCAEIDFPFFKECMSGICDTAAAHNYDIVIVMADGSDLTQVQRVVAKRKVDGVIVTRALESSALQAYLKEKEVPFVMIGTPAKDAQAAPWIDNENREGSCELTGLLLGQGRRRLALLGGNRTHRVTDSRLQGFLDAYRCRELSPERELIFLDLDSYAGTAAAADRILAAGADGILCMDDSIANMLLGCLRERKIAVPRQICVASLYDSALLEYHSPTVTSLHFNTRGLGRNACLMLLSQLGERLLQEPAALNYQVIVRESTQQGGAAPIDERDSGQ